MRFKRTKGALLLRVGVILMLCKQQRFWKDPISTALLHLPLVGSEIEAEVNVDFDASSSATTNHTSGGGGSVNCDRILLYASDIITNDTGVGHRTSFYVLASLLAVLTDSALVILDPPSDGQWEQVGGSPFGCPINNSDKDCNGLPTGLGRIIRVQDWLSRGCAVPCSHTHSYDDWVKIAERTTRRNNFASTVCKENNGDAAHGSISASADNNQGENVTVLAIGKIHLRNFWQESKRSEFFFGRLQRNMKKSQQIKAWEQRITPWLRRMGASTEDIKHFLTNKTISPMTYLSALIQKADIVQFQPWVIKDVHESLRKVAELPQLLYNQPQSPVRLLRSSADSGYDAMHIRRGDRIRTSDTMEGVERYWVKQGYPPVNISANRNSLDIKSEIISDSYPTNYLPFTQYWNEYNASKCTNHGQSKGTNQRPTRYVYIATDDIETVRSEIANLTSLEGSEHLVHCNENIEFVFYPQELARFTKHLHVSNQVDTRNQGAQLSNDEVLLDEAYEQYHRAISAIADLHILSQRLVPTGQ